MKTLWIASLLTFASLSAFAQPINLKAGSSVVVNGDLVTCEPPPAGNGVPACSIVQDGSWYRVYAGSVIAQSYYHFDEAIDGVKKMQGAGLCR
jgi:hypothetical protein